MHHRTVIMFLLSIAFAGITTACNPCEKLDAKICEDLGEADCALWRKHDRPGFMGTGRRASRTCTNHMIGSQYDLQLNVVRKSLDAYKNIPAATKPTPAEPADKAAAAPEPAKTAQNAEQCVALEQKLCTKLGDDCAAWKAKGKPGLADKNPVQCKMAVEKELFFKKAFEAARAGLK